MRVEVAIADLEAFGVRHVVVHAGVLLGLLGWHVLKRLREGLRQVARRVGQSVDHVGDRVAVLDTRIPRI